MFAIISVQFFLDLCPSVPFTLSLFSLFSGLDVSGAFAASSGCPRCLAPEYESKASRLAVLAEAAVVSLAACASWMRTPASHLNVVHFP